MGNLERLPYLTAALTRLSEGKPRDSSVTPESGEDSDADWASRLQPDGYPIHLIKLAPDGTYYWAGPPLEEMKEYLELREQDALRDHSQDGTDWQIQYPDDSP